MPLMIPNFQHVAEIILTASGLFVSLILKCYLIGDGNTGSEVWNLYEGKFKKLPFSTSNSHVLELIHRDYSLLIKILES